MIIIVIYVLMIVLYGVFKRINCYDSFKKGVSENIKILLDIFPNILALVFAVEVFCGSGILTILNTLFSNLIIPCEIILQGILKPISSSSSLIMMLQIFNNYGVNSNFGILSSIIQGCSDTTFYIITLYFSCVKIKDYKYALKAGLLTDILTFLIVVIVFILITSHV